MNNIDQLVEKAVKGDKGALEKVILEIQKPIYNMAMRMLWHPDDAKDASQEVLIRVITNLGTFDFRSSFKTWLYRLTSNSLMNFKKKFMRHHLAFEDYEKQLAQGQSDTLTYTQNKAEQNLLVQEAKIGCSQGMLQCLTDEDRMVYILGEILDFDGVEGAEIMEMTHVNFRQKLSRARKRLHNFMHNNCGLIDPKNECRCQKKVDFAIRQGLINPQGLLFARESTGMELISTIDHLENEVALFRSNPLYDTPQEILTEVKKLISNT